MQTCLRRSVRVLLFAMLLLPALTGMASAAPLPVLPDITITSSGTGDGGVTTVQILLLTTLIGVAPSALILLTSFTRIMVVLSFLRSAIGAPNLPPAPVIAALSLFLTIFVMQPTFSAVQQEAWRPYAAGEITQEVALERAGEQFKTFMLAHVRDRDLQLFIELNDAPQPEGPEDLPLSTLIPAFAVSELRTAFEMGFLLYLPFILIDLMVASGLMSVGMMMVPPTTISLPLKVLLFVAADGWRLMVESLVRSFQ